MSDERPTEGVLSTATHFVNAGAIVSLVGVLALKPELLPYAHADHEHDTKMVEHVIAVTVERATLERDIRVLNQEVDDLERQISFNLCLDESCRFEISKLKSAENRRESLNRELDRLTGE